MNQETFDAAERALLAALADVLIPADNGGLSASQAGISGLWLDAVLAARPDLSVHLKELLIKANHRNPAEVVAGLRAADPTAFGVLTEIASGAYFMNPHVRQLIGYTGQDPRPIDPRADYLDDGLLECVIRRGPIYRPTPKDNQ